MARIGKRIGTGERDNRCSTEVNEGKALRWRPRMHLCATESDAAISTQLGLGGVNGPDPHRPVVSRGLRRLCGQVDRGHGSRPMSVRGARKTLFLKGAEARAKCGTNMVRSAHNFG